MVRAGLGGFASHWRTTSPMASATADSLSSATLYFRMSGWQDPACVTTLQGWRPSQSNSRCLTFAATVIDAGTGTALASVASAALATSAPANIAQLTVPVRDAATTGMTLLVSVSACNVDTGACSGNVTLNVTAHFDSPRPRRDGSNGATTVNATTSSPSNSTATGASGTANFGGSLLYDNATARLVISLPVFVDALGSSTNVQYAYAVGLSPLMDRILPATCLGSTAPVSAAISVRGAAWPPVGTPIYVTVVVSDGFGIARTLIFSTVVSWQVRRCQYRCLFLQHSQLKVIEVAP